MNKNKFTNNQKVVYCGDNPQINKDYHCIVIMALSNDEYLIACINQFNMVSNYSAKEHELLIKNNSVFSIINL